MAVIVALIGVLLLGPMAVQVLASGQMPASTRATERQDAIEAAHAGLSDYVNHLQGPYAYLEYCSTGWDALNVAVSSGTTYTSLTLAAVPTTVAAGDQIELVTSTGPSQTVTVAAGAATGPTTGPTTIAVDSFTATTSFPAGTPALDTTSMAWASTWVCPPGSGPDPANPAFASYPDDGHWAYVDAGPGADHEAFQYVVDSAGATATSLALSTWWSTSPAVPGRRGRTSTRRSRPPLRPTRSCSTRTTAPGRARW